MERDNLTHSEKYVKKTNRIILAIGITSLLIFIFGVFLLIKSNQRVDDYEEPVFTDNADVLNVSNTAPLAQNIEFSTVDGEIPLTTTPDPVPMGQVVLGTEAKNVLTLGTTGKTAVQIVSVDLAEPPAAGFTFENGCNNRTLSGDETCHITMSWAPVVAGNVQNNFIISWYELNLGQSNVKSAKVPVTGNAVTKEECTVCETVVGSSAGGEGSTAKAVRNAIGPDGKLIGYVDEDGYVRDANGNIIGRVGADGLIMDENGNVTGVADNRRAVYDEFGNLVGYVNPDGTVVDKDGNIIGRVLPDGTVVDMDGKVIGRAIDTGFVYDKDGNIIGRVLPDGTVVDMDGNVIGRVLPDGSVVDLNGNAIGSITKPGRVAVDENGNVLGVVMPDGSVVDKDGNTVGQVDENGNIVKKGTIEKSGQQRRLAYDANGNVIGYIDENGNVVDFNGNVIGRMLEDGTLVDADGNVIGKAGDFAALALDENGNVIGYVGADGKIYDADGNVIGMDGKIIGALVKVGYLPITPQGTLLGTVQNDGTIENENRQTVGRALANGLVRDTNGSKVIAKMVRGGFVVGFG